MVDNTLKSQAFKLKGRLYTLTVLQLLSGNRQLFEQQLHEVIEKAPKLFDKTPIVLDCSMLEEQDIDLQELCRCLREYGLLPVAVQSANSLLTTIAQCQGLAIVHASSVHDKLLTEASCTETSGSAESLKTKLQTTPVRSGQQVVSKGGDLVITASVSHGAELLADGNIHIYGTLRGRALAGLSGDKQARIFCQSLDAELVAIAGFYRLSHAIEAPSGPCQIYLQDDHIHIESIS